MAISLLYACCMSFIGVVVLCYVFVWAGCRMVISWARCRTFCIRPLLCRTPAAGCQITVSQTTQLHLEVSLPGVGSFVETNVRVIVAIVFLVVSCLYIVCIIYCLCYVCLLVCLFIICCSSSPGPGVGGTRGRRTTGHCILNI